MTKLYHLTIEMEDRLRVLQLLFCIDLPVISVHVDPGSSGRKAGIFTIIPLHGSSRIIPADLLQKSDNPIRWKLTVIHKIIISIQRFQIPVLRENIKACIRHSKFLSLINIGSSLHEIHTDT